MEKVKEKPWALSCCSPSCPSSGWWHWGRALAPHQGCGCDPALPLWESALGMLEKPPPSAGIEKVPLAGLTHPGMDAVTQGPVSSQGLLTSELCQARVMPSAALTSTRTPFGMWGGPQLSLTLPMVALGDSILPPHPLPGLGDLAGMLGMVQVMMSTGLRCLLSLLHLS